ncbi:DUF6933 domain-containing protein [Rhizocola hellebori]|uniref:DUF6933 domain-containing protein n=1 Tax=Rhizocola hellebori TaxID=1392758 RepID=UPI001944A9DA|nr:hypothetical protein [Rhizocola hellebori]
MLIVRATKKLLDRVGGPDLTDDTLPSTLLGQWYATSFTWRPQVVLLVNELTLLPVLMPLAPASNLSSRIGAQITTVLAAHGATDHLVESEAAQMSECRFGKTASRSMLGIMNEFTFLADSWRGPELDLISLSLRLAATPCGPLYRRSVSPDRELVAYIASVGS